MLALAGCGSYQADMQMFCDAPKKVSAVGISPEERAMKLSEYVAKNTRSAEARKVFQALAAAPDERRGEILTQSVREAGLDPASCEMLKQYE